MKISKKTQYGLRAMIYLAKFYKKRICPLKEISKKENISFDFLEKIMTKLEKSKLVKAKKGILGGYFLAKDPKKIKISEIIKSLEKDQFFVKCFQQFCPKEKKCLARNFWKRFNKIIFLNLNSITLSDLIKK